MRLAKRTVTQLLVRSLVDCSLQTVSLSTRGSYISFFNLCIISFLISAPERLQRGSGREIDGGLSRGKFFNCDAKTIMLIKDLVGPGPILKWLINVRLSTFESAEPRRGERTQSCDF